MAAPPAAELAAICATYRSGLSLEETGARHGRRSGDTIGRLLRKAGEPIRPRGRPRRDAAPAAAAAIIALHEQGLPPSVIARQVPGSGPAAIAAQLRAAGCVPHRARPLPAGPVLAVAYARAGSVRSLARQLHADEDRIRAALTDAGCPPGSLRAVPPRRRVQAAEAASVLPGGPA